ncbi:MAG: hypothetical protein ACREQ5_09655, partial [Candidatus Dormibacteria bacterium]
FVEMRTRMNRNQYAMFTDEEQTRKLLKSPEAGMHYHWARHPQYDPTGTAMRVSMGLYKYVLPSEIRADATPMFVNHKGTTGTMVGFGTLVLVKESDEAYQETHIGPQIDAIAQLSRIETEFEGKVEEDSGGRAKGTIERTVEQEEITP